MFEFVASSTKSRRVSFSSKKIQRGFMFALRQCVTELKIYLRAGRSVRLRSLNCRRIGTSLNGKVSRRRLSK